MTSVSDKKVLPYMKSLVAVTIYRRNCPSIYSAFNTGITAYKKMDTLLAVSDARIILNS
jgi:hypothetical protein